jgi:hypothetical protein
MPRSGTVTQAIRSMAEERAALCNMEKAQRVLFPEDQR